MLQRGLGFEIVPVTVFEQNASVVWCEQTRLAAIIDPGAEIERLREVVQRRKLELDKILITHAHLDHAGATAALARATGVPIIGPHKEDQFWIDAMPMQAAQFGFEGEKFVPDKWLQHGDTVALGDLVFDVIHCPGHTPGHVVFVEQEKRFAVVGDVLFSGSIGRTDFPRGNHAQLVDSIRNRLLPLGGDIVFNPGHGPMSSFGEEQKSNPYISDKAVGEA